MADRYFFDKRDWKRRWGKYGIIFLISFVPIVCFNLLCSDYLGADWLVILIDCILLLGCVAIGSAIANKIFERNDAKLDRLRKEREEIEERKKQIMEDSYKRKREEKKASKEKKIKLSESVESSDEIIVEVEESKTPKKTNSRSKK